MMKKFSIIQPWLKNILTILKKEIKGDLLTNKDLFRRLFGNRSFNSLTNEEIIVIFEKKVNEDENLQDWVVSRWIYHNSDIYEYFYSELSKINPKVEEIKNIAKEQAMPIIEFSINSFGPGDTYIFAVLNEVSFSQDVLDDLRKKGLLELNKNKEKENNIEKNSLEDLVKKQEEDISRLKDKYEKKISSMKKKYFDDIETLKNQISKLQQKIAQK